MEEKKAESKNKCPKCGGTGTVRDKDGTIHTCFDCLFSDKLDQHGSPKESGIRL
jgi:hypothetical protein